MYALLICLPFNYVTLYRPKTYMLNEWRTKRGAYRCISLMLVCYEGVGAMSSVYLTTKDLGLNQTLICGPFLQQTPNWEQQRCGRPGRPSRTCTRRCWSPTWSTPWTRKWSRTCKELLLNRRQCTVSNISQPVCIYWGSVWRRRNIHLEGNRTTGKP